MKSQSILTLVLGISFSILVYFQLNYENTKEKNTLLKVETSNYTHELESNINASFLAVRALKLLFYTSSDSITFDRFNEYAVEILDYSPGLKALEWIPVVSGEQKNDFISTMQLKYNDFDFHGYAKDKLNDPAAIFLPVYYVIPYTPNQAAHGYDLASNKTRFAAFSKAAFTDQMILTDPIHLIQDNETTFGYLSVLSVSKGAKANGFDDIDGFAIGVFNISEVISNSISNMIADHYFLQIEDKNAEQIVFSNFKEDFSNDGLFTHEIEIANRNLLISYKANIFYLQSLKSSNPLVILSAGLLITFILSFAFYLNARKNFQLQKSNKIVSDREEEFELFFSNSFSGFFFMMFDEAINWNSDHPNEIELEYAIDNLKITKSNLFILNQYELDKQDFLGMTPRQLFNDDEAHVKSVYKQLFDSGSVRVETVIQKPDGSLAYLEADYICMHDDNDRIKGHFAVQIDVTDRKMSLDLFEHQSEMLEVLTSISSKFIKLPLEEIDASLQTSLEELGQLANADRAYIFKYDWKNRKSYLTYEWCEKGVNGFIKEMQGVDIDSIFELVEPHLKGKPIYVPEVEKLKNEKSKSMFVAQEIKSFLTVPMMKSGKCVGFVGFDSVFYPKQYNQKEIGLLKLYADMVVNIRTRAEEMEENQKLLKTTVGQNKRLKDFAFIISHNVRSSVSNLIGISSIIQSEPNNQKFIDMLSVSSSQLDKTVNNVNDLLKSENEFHKLEISTCNIVESISRVLKLNNKIVADKELKLDLDIPEELNIQAVPAYLDSILHNVIFNAIKYGTDDDSNQISFYSEETESDVIVIVRDYGKGINLSENLRRVFEPGSRFNSQSEGQGLGLYLVKNQIESLGGKVEVRSRKNRGTEMALFFPKKKDYFG